MLKGFSFWDILKRNLWGEDWEEAKPHDRESNFLCSKA
jgi:hypothetical protein